MQILVLESKNGVKEWTNEKKNNEKEYFIHKFLNLFFIVAYIKVEYSRRRSFVLFESRWIAHVVLCVCASFRTRKRWVSAI